jgi:hypothetical protein
MAVVDADVGMSLKAFVFLIMIWQSPDIGPTVVALWIDILLAIVPGGHQYNSIERTADRANSQGGLTRFSKNRAQWFDVQ